MGTFNLIIKRHLFGRYKFHIGLAMLLACLYTNPHIDVQSYATSVNRQHIIRSELTLNLSAVHGDTKSDRLMTMTPVTSFIAKQFLAVSSPVKMYRTTL